MSMYLYALGGLVLLFGGGEALVRGAVAVSRRLGLSPLLIGMTVVAWCTSAPELVVSMGSALDGRAGLAVGNVLGSNIFNILGVLGAAALVTPIVVKPLAVRRDLLVMLGAAVALTVLARTGSVGPLAGLVLLAALVGYVFVSYRAERSDPASPAAELHEHESEEVGGGASLAAGIAYFAGGLAALVVGSRLLIVGASEIARTFGVSEAVIGLSLVAVGTSLPELATSMVAAFRRHADVAIGNVVGSNIFNVLGIIGLTALVSPLDVAARMAEVDVWVMLGVSVALVPLLLLRGAIGRVSGVVFLAAYVVYLVILF